MAQAANSGWSYGPVQFDIGSNNTARSILYEIYDRKTVDYLAHDRYNRPLANRDKVEAEVKRVSDAISNNWPFILEQCQKWIDRQIRYIKTLDIPFELDDEALAYLLDYHVQFELDNNGKCHKWLHTQTHFDPEAFLEFKLTQLKYGRTEKGAHDVRRRYKIVKEFVELEYAKNNYPSWINNQLGGI
jgi:hypothetical protein